MIKKANGSSVATTEDISENVILKILVIKGYGTDNPLQNTYSQKNYYFNWKAFSVLDIFCIFCIPFSVSSLSSANLKWETWIASALFKKKRHKTTSQRNYIQIF